MKKVFLLTLAAALLVVSCAKDETISTPKQKAIGFSAFVNTPVKGAIDPSTTLATLESFDVYGFTQAGKIFDGVTVSKSGTTWSYSPTQYWVAGNTYTFGAIAPADTEVANVALADGAVGMTIAFTNDGATDLLHAAPDSIAFGVTSTVAPVTLDFAHQLAKAKFTFANGIGEGYNVKVKDIKIIAPKTATLTIAAAGNTWSNQADTVHLSFGNAIDDLTEGTTEIIANAADAESANERLLIPNDNIVAATTEGYLYIVTFDTELYQGDVLLGEYKNSGTINAKLQAGYAYNFGATLTIGNIDPDGSLKPIEFTVTSVADWNTPTAQPTFVLPEPAVEGL